MSNELIFIPGLDCRVSKDYPNVSASLRSAGFAVDAIDPAWGSDFVTLVSRVGSALAKKVRWKPAIVVAHSVGANIAMQELARHKNIGVILTSPSVACVEGYRYQQGRELMERYFSGQRDAVERFSLASLSHAAAPRTRAAVLVGGKETSHHPLMNDLARIAASALGVKVTRVPGAPHAIDASKKYIQAVVDAALQIRKNMS